MKISLFSILTLAAASFAMPSMAQQTVYLNKGEQKVETVDLGPNDYLSFGRPEGVKEQAKAEITDVKTTKTPSSIPSPRRRRISRIITWC